MALVIFLIIVFIADISKSCANEKDIVCKTVCIQDGDETGYVKNDICYCSNERDISKVYIKVPRVAQEKKKPNNWLYQGQDQ